MATKILTKPITEVTPAELSENINALFRQKGGPLPEEIEEICKIYFAAVSHGDQTTELAGISKNALRMIRLGNDHIVKSKLHHQLCCCRDSYYDFVFTIENNVKNDREREGRLIHFLSRHPDSSAYEILIYDSMIDMDPEITDAYIESVMPYFDQDEISCESQIVAAREMEMYELVNHGWIQSKVFVEKRAYTVCQSCSACLIDYLGHCVALACINKCQEGVARIVFIRTKTKSIHEDLTDMLLDYLEKMAKKNGFDTVIVDSTTPCWDFYEENGYQRADGSPYGYEEEILKKDFLKRRIAPVFVVPDMDI